MSFVTENPFLDVGPFMGPEQKTLILKGFFPLDLE
jgi:hypothetical protein